MTMGLFSFLPTGNDGKLRNKVGEISYATRFLSQFMNLQQVANKRFVKIHVKNTVFFGKNPLQNLHRKKTQYTFTPSTKKYGHHPLLHPIREKDQ